MIKCEPNSRNCEHFVPPTPPTTKEKTNSTTPPTKIEEPWFLDEIEITSLVLGITLFVIVLLLTITICCVKNQRVIAVAPAPQVTINMTPNENQPHDDNIYYDPLANYETQN